MQLLLLESIDFSTTGDIGQLEESPQPGRLERFLAFVYSSENPDAVRLRDHVHAFAAAAPNLLEEILWDFLNGRERNTFLFPVFGRSVVSNQTANTQQVKGKSRGKYLCWICRQPKRGGHYCFLPMKEEG